MNRSRWRQKDPEGWTIRDVPFDEVEKNILNCGSTRESPTVVFDLDGTLFDVNPRTLGIMDSWLQSSIAMNFSKQVMDRLRTIEFRHVGYSVQDSFRNLGFDLEDPEVAVVYQAVQREWKRRFFDGKTLLIYDTPLPGAVSFVRRLHAQKFRLIYLSGRASKSMTDGTRKQLEKAGFPLDNAEIVLKPDAAIEDHLFKPMAFAKISANHNVIANFENEYVNIGAMALVNSNCVHVIVDSPHSDKIAAPVATLFLRVTGFQTGSC